MPSRITNAVKDPTKDDLLLAPPYVHGFSLVDKRWLMFDINHLTTIKFDPTSFANLCIPDDRKALLKSLVEVYGGSDKRSFEDIVAGKGKGLVINLFGPPGTGKTLTAEAMSEYVKKPLYTLTAGTLGSDPASLSNTLSHTFDISHKWNALVLLDEADIFLERRSTHEIHRNAMVSVFLRELEYFEGILFLTTNRIETFDPAFQSRIHISLRYGHLNYRARKDVWLAILRKVGLHEDNLTPSELRKLAGRVRNGRQIRNIVRTAEAVAEARKEPLDFEHLEAVRKVGEKFEMGEGSTLSTSLMTMAPVLFVASIVGTVIVRQLRALR